MDRNENSRNSQNIKRGVALRKESVDRNYTMQVIIIIVDTSLSARRAWIEIMDDLEPSKTRRVALRKESVDRNFRLFFIVFDLFRSLSARRAWIEILNWMYHIT